MIRFYKAGDDMGISTDANDEAQFLNQVATALDAMIERGAYHSDWEFQLRLWLAQIVDICCKLRGYKADVIEKRVILAGTTTGAPLAAEIDDRDNTLLYTPTKKDLEEIDEFLKSEKQKE